MTATAKMKHPDAVFGPDEDVVMQLIERLKVSDVRAFTPDNQSKISLAISAAAKRLVEDYTQLVRDREALVDIRIQLDAKRVEIEAREAAVSAREILLGLHPEPVAAPKKSILNFWK